MHEPHTELYVHLVWATWDRLPLITPIIRDPLYAILAQRCRAQRCEPIAIGGMPDHVHLLVRLHPCVAIAPLVKDVKGASSHLVAALLKPREAFRWQGRYGAFTVGRRDLQAVTDYVRGQEEHHDIGNLTSHWELLETPE